MRDESRITQILSEIEKRWQAYPDLRLGQLLVNVILPKKPCPEIFYLEDTELLKRLAAQPASPESKSTHQTSTWHWKHPLEIARTPVEELSLDGVKEFIEVVEAHIPGQILTPRSMLELCGAPTDDMNWMREQHDRLKKLEQFLRTLWLEDQLYVVETGYRVKR